PSTGSTNRALPFATLVLACGRGGGLWRRGWVLAASFPALSTVFLGPIAPGRIASIARLFAGSRSPGVSPTAQQPLLGGHRCGFPTNFAWRPTVCVTAVPLSAYRR